MKMCERLVELRTEIVDQKEKWQSLCQERDALADHEIPTLMLQLGYVNDKNNGSRSLPNGSIVYLAPERQVSVKQEHRDQVVKWFKEHPDFKDFVKEDVHHSRMRSILLQMLDEGRRDELPEVVTIFQKTTARIKRAGKVADNKDDDEEIPGEF